MTKQQQLTWNEFAAKYGPIGNHFDENAPHEGKMFETFGPELAFVTQQDPRTVWTVIAEGDSEFILNGFAVVNRMGYIVTVDKHDGDKGSVYVPLLEPPAFNALSLEMVLLDHPEAEEHWTVQVNIDDGCEVGYPREQPMDNDARLMSDDAREIVERHLVAFYENLREDLRGVKLHR